MKVLPPTIITGTAGGAAPERRAASAGFPCLRTLEFVLSLAAVARPAPNTRRSFDRLTVESFANRAEMGAAAASDVASALKERLSAQAGVRIIFAAAPSQADMLRSSAPSMALTGAASPLFTWMNISVLIRLHPLALPIGSTSTSSTGCRLPRCIASRPSPMQSWRLVAMQTC